MASLDVLKFPPGVVLADLVIPLTGRPQVIGRDRNCDIIIQHLQLSRQHARITCEEGVYSIEDLKSRNGTSVNTNKIVERTPLQEGDWIEICGVVMRFSCPEIQALSDSAESTALYQSFSHELRQQFQDMEAAFRRIFEWEPLLQFLTETIFTFFSQTDSCYILFQENGTLVPSFVRHRGSYNGPHHFPKVIAKRTFESQTAYVLRSNCADADMSRIPESDRLSIMSVPLIDSGRRTFGVIQLEVHNRVDAFTLQDMNLLAAIGNSAAAALVQQRRRQSTGNI